MLVQMSVFIIVSGDFLSYSHHIHHICFHLDVIGDFLDIVFVAIVFDDTVVVLHVVVVSDAIVAGCIIGVDGELMA